MAGHPVLVRLREVDHARLLEEARVEGVSLPELLRSRALGREPSRAVVAVKEPVKVPLKTVYKGPVPEVAKAPELPTAVQLSNICGLPVAACARKLERGLVTWDGGRWLVA